ncbi:MAG: T9SS type A sorting domain-containing protein [Ignavibacteriota bacterium]
MMKCLIVLGVMFFASAALSQSAEKIYSVANPYGAAARVESISVDDTSNFRVESLKALPYDVSELGTVDFKVSIVPHDGITRSTQVRCRDSRGCIAYTVTLSAPVTNAVKVGEEQYKNHPAYPNPVTDFCTINTDISLYPNVQIELFNALGSNVVGLVQPIGHALSLDARNLTSGRYHLSISSNGSVIRSEDIIVKH